MKKGIFICLLFILISCHNKVQESAKMSFWNETKRGANNFNKVPTKERFLEAKKFGIEILRLTPSKWDSSTEGKHFLIGDIDNYTELNKLDMERLKEILSWANEAGIKIVLTFIALPNYKWSQQNNGIQDRRLFEDFKYQDVAIKFWKDIAHELKDNDAIVAYNVLNEPSPELAEPKLEDWYTDGNEYEEWYSSIKGTSQDLNLFYDKMIASIRSEDTKTPIVLDTGYFGTVWGIKVMKKYEDPNILYSFHMYEPYYYTSMKDVENYQYNGEIPFGETHKRSVMLNKDFFEMYFRPILDWQKKNNVSSKQIFLGEFGGRRRTPGLETYFKDLLTYVEAQKWHWAFYSFREDEWDGMDYEWGTGNLPYKEYWGQKEKGENPIYPEVPSSLFATIINFIPKK